MAFLFFQGRIFEVGSSDSENAKGKISFSLSLFPFLILRFCFEFRFRFLSRVCVLLRMKKEDFVPPRLSWYLTSVTRFGEISPFWPKFKLIWQHFEGLFSIGHNIESSLAPFVSFWANVCCCEQPYNEKINLTSGHTGGNEESFSNHTVLQVVTYARFGLISMQPRNFLLSVALSKRPKIT